MDSTPLNDARARAEKRLQSKGLGMGDTPLLDSLIHESEYGWVFGVRIREKGGIGIAAEERDSNILVFISKISEDACVFDRYGVDVVDYLASSWGKSSALMPFDEFTLNWETSRREKKKLLKQLRAKSMRVGVVGGYIYWTYFFIPYKLLRMSKIERMASASLRLQPFFSEDIFVIADGKSRKYYISMYVGGFRRMIRKMEYFLGEDVLVSGNDGWEIELNRTTVRHAWPREELDKYFSSKIKVSVKKEHRNRLNIFKYGIMRIETFLE